MGGLLDINAVDIGSSKWRCSQESYVPTRLKQSNWQLKQNVIQILLVLPYLAKKVEVDTSRDLHIPALQDLRQL